MSEPFAADMLRQQLVQDPNNKSTASVSPEYQVADLYVSKFPRAAGGMGHVGIGINTPETEGFYPAKNTAATITGYSPPGVVKPDDMSAPHETLRIPTTPAQDDAVSRYIQSRKENPGDYSLYTENCKDFVGDALQAGKITPPQRVAPIDFYRDLDRIYGPKRGR